MDDGADQVEEHHPRNERQAGDARAGAALSASWRRLARKTRPPLLPVAHRAFRERLLLTFAPLRQSATSENQRRLLDEEASAEHGPGQGDHQAPEEVRLAMRGHLGVPGEGSRQIGQDSSPPVRFGSPALIAAVGLEGRCRPLSSTISNARRGRRSRSKVSIGGVELGWERYIGFEGRFVGLHSFGASGKIADVYKKFDINADVVVRAAHETLADAAAL
jgi:Transketolase-like TK C-terminal domain